MTKSRKLSAPAPEAQENVLLEWGKTIVISLCLAFGIRTFIAEARYIPSASMEPTLQINDRLLIDKVSYRFQPPQRGDIVVFQPTAELRQQNFHDAFIKRIIGLPGETVLVKQGRVYINGRPLTESYIASPPDYEYGPVVVPQDAFLVLGDNRNHSFDSHFWGFVPRQNIIGRALVRFWPLNRLGEVETAGPQWAAPGAPASN